MKTLTTLFSKVYFGVKKLLKIKKTESEMSIDEYIESVQNRRQQFSNITLVVNKKINQPVKSDDDLEASSSLVLA